MPAAITLDVAYDRLYNFLPDWHVGVTSTEWIRRWMEATGDSRATAFRMQHFAFEISEAEFKLRFEHPCETCGMLKPSVCPLDPKSCALIHGSI